MTRLDTGDAAQENCCLRMQSFIKGNDEFTDRCAEVAVETDGSRGCRVTLP